MKALILAAALGLSACATAEIPGYYVFGDSLTSPSISWANQLNREGLTNLQINAVPGRRLIDLTIPTDLRYTGEIQGVIIHLGTNDAGWGVPLEEFRQHYVDIIGSIDPDLSVVCVLPPYNDWNTPVDPFRATVMEICPTVWDVPTSHRSDGIHPNAWGQFWHATVIYQLMKEEAQ
jgi:lysophospholipase L1-like esterase